MKKVLLGILTYLIALGAAFADPVSNLNTVAGTPSWIAASGYSLAIGTAGTTPINFFTNGTKQWYIDGTTGALTGASGVGVSQTGDIIVSASAKGFVAGEAARAANVTTATTLAAPLYISGAASTTDLGAFVGSGASSSGPVLDFFKTRATTGQASTIVQSGDVLGQVKFFGANGTTYDPAVIIKAVVDTTPGASADMPGGLDILVAPDSSATPASALKINNDKTWTFNAVNMAITASTADAADTSRLMVGGGGGTAADGSRGGQILMYGNENAAAGRIDIVMGATSNLRVIGNTGATVTATFGGTSAGGLTVNTGMYVSNAANFETVAAGTSVQGDGPLTAGKQIHLVTGFDETKVATLPACAAGNVGEIHFILNNTTNKFAKIFPASGAQINSLGANTAYVQGVTGQGGKVLLCACQAANQWYCA